jgi:Ras-related protein Rab-1A
MSDRFKIILIGDSGVGKTAILKRFVDGSFDSYELITVGIDYRIKDVTIDDATYKLEIWDSAGQERFRVITANSCRGSDAFIYVFDVSNRDSFNNIRHWIRMIEKMAGTKKGIKILVGNKADLVSKDLVTATEATEFADDFDMEYIESSAATGYNINRIFIDTTRLIAEKIKDKSSPTETIKVVSEKTETASCCILV